MKLIPFLKYLVIAIIIYSQASVVYSKEVSLVTGNDSLKKLYDQAKDIQLPTDILSIVLGKKLDNPKIAVLISSTKTKNTTHYNEENSFQGQKGFNMSWTEVREIYEIDGITKKEIKQIFEPSIYMAGRIDLDKNIKSLVLKINDFEDNTYRLFNFDSHWRLVNVVDLCKYRIVDGKKSFLIKSLINKKRELIISFLYSKNKTIMRLDENGSLIIE